MKRGVWILEIHKIGKVWEPVRVYPTRARALQGRLSAECLYRAVRYVPARPTRKARRHD